MKEDKKIELKTPQFTREVIIKNDKILKFLKERDKIAKELNKGSDEYKKFMREQRKREMKMNRIKEKMEPVVMKIDKDVEKNEWERLVQVKLNKDNTIGFEYVDVIESYKKSFLEREKNNGKKH